MLALALSALLLFQGWPPRNGNALPATCVTGEAFFLTSPSVTEFYECTATDTWTHITPGAGGAPTDVTYITQTAHAGLSAEQALSALSTGICKVTTGTGVLSTAVAGDFPTLNQNTTGTAAALTSDPSDCVTSTHFAVGIDASGVPACEAIADADVPNTITLDNLTQVTTRAISDTTGTLAVSRGGTNLTASADDNVMVGNATTWESKAVPDCDTASTSKLLYDTTTNTFSCGTDQGAGSGAALTRISGSSGAAGADLTWQTLSADCAANATTTLATCMTTTSVGSGTWSFKYLVVYQSAATTTGVDFAINHTGTVTKFVGSSWLTTSGGAAATALADQTGSNTANLVEGKMQRTVNTKFGSTLGVDTLNANMLVVIEGLLVISATGSLELKHASEVAASSQVMSGTVLELHKIS